MQDIHDYSMNGSGGSGGSTGRFFVGGIVGGGGGGGGGDRRMRAHQNNILNHHQSLKCPRCNSLNTKFCYYNNYNLSQPRHFCKNCRRYWTKGGVLRNVPVGGGCRKTKRSKSKQPPSSPSSADKPITGEEVVDEKSSSSSESSSLTASNSNVSAFATTVAATTVTDMPNMKIYENGIEWSTLLGQGSSNGGIFSIDTAAFEIGGNSVNQQSIADDDMKLEGGNNNNNTVQQQFGDPTAQIDPLDWGSGVGGGGDDQTLLFDLTSNVDHTYWSQSQWTTSVDQDHNGLYLP